MNQFLAAFAEVESKRDAAPAWRKHLRANAIAQFERLGFPTTRNEEWKYTNVSPILKPEFRLPAARARAIANVDSFTYPESRHSQLVFVNGNYAPEFSDTSGIPAGVTVTNFREADQKLVSSYFATQAGYDNNAFAALNTAFADDGAIILIPRGKIIEAPIHLLFVTENNVISHPRVLLVAEEGAIATVIESYVSLGDEDVYFTNAVTEVITKQDANITHYRLQGESPKAFHIATTAVQQESKSIYASYAIAIGGVIARHDLNVKLEGEHIESTIDGLYVATGKQHIDNHTTMDHAYPHCNSFQLYKGILDDKARAVFNGKVFVREGAVLTDAKQLNKNLLLSSDAHVDTKPQLEIYADDVKCSHGATVGQLEEDELFYLRSRGLKPETARSLLTYGFAEDIISKIKVESVRKQLDEVVLNKLHQEIG
ncbi:MAG: Fe-S cluster assembly protein SufD [Acidobacteria bacterium]|nr:Fe-S cluster assembly protein SufD [Acidobacteriota bacterium]